VHELIVLGEVGRAAAAAAGPGKRACGPAGARDLAALFPEATAGARAPPPPPARPPPPWEAEAAEAVAGSLGKNPRRSGLGLSGARFKHWAALRGREGRAPALA
jgi:hypothetical protein